ncbi:MAG: hypothetical protein AMJ73_08200 [candidate division Zixibacteria bacterium SM1_73]|nr:MAG: hypothetical protein AMJ73_08200 [candidate division Zixibacteria bacterium SM1_73]
MCPNGLSSKIVFFIIRTGQEHYLAMISSCGLAGLVLVLLLWPALSVPAVLATAILFVNIFTSKIVFLISSDVRIMTKKSIFWRPPPISEFLVAFPLDYLTIILSYVNFYLFTSRFSWGTFIDKGEPVSNLHFGESLLYSLSSITTLTHSTVAPITMFGKLLSFSQLLSGIFFLVIFGSMIIGLFLTEKQATEEKRWLEDKEKVWDFFSWLFGCLVTKQKSDLDKPGVTDFGVKKPPEQYNKCSRTQPWTKREVVIKISGPGSPLRRGFQLVIPTHRFKKWMGSLPEHVKDKAPELGSTLDKILQFIDNEAVGHVSNIEMGDKDHEKVIVGLSITEG